MKTIVRPSKIHGNGLFALKDFKKGEIIAKVEGRIVNRQSQSKYAILLNKQQSLIVTNKTKWINHSNRRNARFTKKSVIAVKSIKKGEEILCNYSSIFS